MNIHRQSISGEVNNSKEGLKIQNMSLLHNIGFENNKEYVYKENFFEEVRLKL